MFVKRLTDRQLWILTFALCMALNIIMRFVWEINFPAEITGDGRAYLGLAINISEYGIFGNQQTHQYFWPPFWPWVLSFFTNDLMKESVFVIQTLNAVLTWFVARVFFPKIWFCILISLLFTFNPSHLLISNTLGTEHLFLMLYLLLIYGLWYCIKRLNLAECTSNINSKCLLFGSLFCGIILGLTAVTRGTTSVHFVLFPILSVFVFFRYQKKKLAFFLLFTAIIGFLPPLAWSIRNTNHSEHFIFISANGSENLWLGNNKNPEALWVPADSEYRSDFVGLSTDEHVTLWNKQTKEYLLNHPFQAFSKTSIKLKNLYNPALYPLEFRWSWMEQEYNRSWLIYNGINELFFFLMVIGFILFCFNINSSLLFCDRTMIVILIFAVLTTTLMHCLTWGLPRYRYPIESFLWMFAAAGWYQFIHEYRSSSKKVSKQDHPDQYIWPR